jgi:hypothetical protein
MANKSIVYLIFNSDLVHCHTFENRSSLAPNPAAGLPGVTFAAGGAGAAVLHPPKSSSAATFGAA